MDLYQSKLIDLGEEKKETKRNECFANENPKYTQPPEKTKRIPEYTLAARNGSAEGESSEEETKGGPEEEKNRSYASHRYYDRDGRDKWRPRDRDQRFRQDRDVKRSEPRPETRWEPRRRPFGEGNTAEEMDKAARLAGIADPCPQCKQEHLIIYCPEMKDWDGRKMTEVVKGWKRCIACLRPEHQKNEECRARACRHCGKMHHSRLCWNPKKRDESTQATMFADQMEAWEDEKYYLFHGVQLERPVTFNSMKYAYVEEDNEDYDPGEMQQKYFRRTYTYLMAKVGQL